ncbi:RNA polymerase sigma factor [Spirillospora sp. NBC_01491]|uniref:RNA polymerase sigma factor n=1 Tax=Spirillospora sp. NBC_01491 TaxID=2976007 RepID=UPI002E364C7E|nr:RNA polymerase sigma factor [Spirillospora sp. NBC_01491]
MTAPPETDRADDAALLAASVRDGDSFTAVYDRYFADVHRYVAGRLGTQAADDVVAETFLTAFRRRAAFDPARGTVRPWLFGIATNLIAQHRRTETRRYRALARLGAEPPTDGHEDRVLNVVASDDMQPRLARALALPASSSTGCGSRNAPPAPPGGVPSCGAASAWPPRLPPSRAL